MPSAPTTFPNALNRLTKDDVRVLSAALDIVQTLLDPIHARVKALEQRPHLEHQGAHQDGKAYPAGALVQRQGAMWMARVTTTATPGAETGEERGWVLVAKAARDGRDAPDHSKRLDRLEADLRELTIQTQKRGSR